MFPLCLHNSEKISISSGNLLFFPEGWLEILRVKGTEQDQSSAQIDLQLYYCYYYYFDNVNILEDKAL